MRPPTLGGIYVPNGTEARRKVIDRSGCGRILEERGAATNFLPLGYLLADEPAIFVSNLLTHLATLLQMRFPSIPPAPQFSRTASIGSAAGIWLQQVQRGLPRGARIVLAIDDFDELPSAFFDGPEASTFFIFLRALVAESWLSLLLVGSEIMPRIMAGQNYKLNQVARRNLDTFKSSDDTSRLLIAPTTDRMEWTELATERVHYLSGGNPYFATLLAQEIWRTIRRA